MFSKSTSVGITAMVRLAQETAREKPRPLTAKEIAVENEIQAPFMAKILSTLSQYNMVQGNPGPHGGYTLTRTPESISLYDIACLFERTEPPQRCLFGPGNCGQKNKCAMHSKIDDLYLHRESFLKDTTLANFVSETPRSFS